MYIMLYVGAWLCVMLYICMAQGNPRHPNPIFFTLSFWLIVEECSIKSNSLFLVITWQIIIILAKFFLFMLTPLIDHIFVFSNSWSLCALQISDSTLINKPTPQTPFSYFQHWIIWVLFSHFFLASWSSLRKISHLFYQINVAHNEN